MRYHISDFIYLLKRDYYTRRRIKSILVLGCSVTLILILFVSAVGLYFMKPLLGFILANIPILNEILFTHMRNVVLPYLQEDMLGMFSGFINNTNVDELKSIVNTYFEQLTKNNQIDYQSFQKFITTAKNVISDGIVLPSELNTIKKLLPTESITM